MYLGRLRGRFGLGVGSATVGEKEDGPRLNVDHVLLKRKPLKPSEQKRAVGHVASYRLSLRPGATDAKLVLNLKVVETTGREIVRPPRPARPRGGASVQTTNR